MSGLFADLSFHDVAEQIRKQVRHEVSGKNADYLLGVNEDDFINHLESKYKIDLIEFHWDRVEAEAKERHVRLSPARSFSYMTDSIVRQVFTYFIPFDGSADVLRFRPARRIVWSMPLRVENGCLCFEVVDWEESPKNVKKEADQLMDNIRTQYANLKPELERFNEGFRIDVAAAVKERKADLLKKANVAAELGVPIRKSSSIPPTFTVPAPKRRAIVEQPPAPTTRFAPEPTLNEQSYMEVLQVINDAGVEMERHPSIYSDKGEEALRDHFLMVLAPNFQSTTGETFNKRGKTDILIRHEKSNLFVAECKFWEGQKLYHKTIDQLLSYLTWRDSKAALIVFVNNKELSPVLTTIEGETPKHGCFVKFKGRIKDGWLSYELHLPSDKNRHVHVAVLVFHFP